MFDTKIKFNMIINKITGEEYRTRKEAKEKLGHTLYNIMVKKKDLLFTVNVYEPTDIILP